MGGMCRSALSDKRTCEPPGDCSLIPEQQDRQNVKVLNTFALPTSRLADHVRKSYA